MIILMQPTATEAMVKKIEDDIIKKGGKVQRIVTNGQVTLHVIQTMVGESLNFKRMEGVKDVINISKPYRKVGRGQGKSDVVVSVKEVSFGGVSKVIIAGPCAVESEEQIMTIAHAVKQAGAHMLRGGAFKPRTSPYSFQGLGEEGLKLLRKAGDATGLPVVTEIMAVEQLEMVMKYADMLQVGARNMQNFDLLKALSKIKKPILLKRGVGATLEEFLLSSEYLLEGGNDQVVLCERGIRVPGEDRLVLDVNGIALLKQMTHLPVIADPSHAAGRHDLVVALSKAGLAAGADGLIIEVHHEPEKALCDGKQALTVEVFGELMGD